MKVHDTHELHLRATAHAKEDHLKQGTYGDVTKNGKLNYVGCAIGCLSTPHRKAELIRFLTKHTTVNEWKLAGKTQYDVSFDLDSNDQREMLTEEFGICRALAVTAEGFFEAQPTHGAAIEFFKRFALALNEGANFTHAQVIKKVSTLIGKDVSTITAKQPKTNGYGDLLYPDGTEYEYDAEIANSFQAISMWLKRNPFDTVTENKFEGDVAEVTDKFIGWVKGIGA